MITRTSLMRKVGARTITAFLEHKVPEGHYYKMLFVRNEDDVTDDILTMETRAGSVIVYVDKKPNPNAMQDLRGIELEPGDRITSGGFLLLTFVTYVA